MIARVSPRRKTRQIHIGDLAMYTLAAITVFLIFGLTAITLNVFKVLREQILAADASEKMAASVSQSTASARPTSRRSPR